jgi:dihydrofolate reductase
MSVDGYIAALNDDLSFLNMVAKEGEDYGYQEFTATVDTVIVGRKTYEWILQHADFPYADKTVYIITRTSCPSVGNIHFYVESGTRLFKDSSPQLPLELVSAQSYNTGLVQLRYRKVQDV